MSDVNVDDEYVLTTSDNPWNPYTHWDEWFAFDTSKGYNTCGLLARISGNSFELSDVHQDLVIKQAIDDIVRLNINGMYMKITKDGKVMT